MSFPKRYLTKERQKLRSACNGLLRHFLLSDAYSSVIRRGSVQFVSPLIGYIRENYFM